MKVIWSRRFVGVVDKAWRSRIRLCFEVVKGYYKIKKASQRLALIYYVISLHIICLLRLLIQHQP